MHQFFLDCELSSIHVPYSSWALDDERFITYTCFTDGKLHSYRMLDKVFSDARFILLTRSLGAWLKSRVLHKFHAQDMNKQLAWMGHYDMDPLGALVAWVQNRDRYYQSVHEYFFSSSRAPLLVVNICEGDNTSNRGLLYDFLELELVEPKVSIVQQNKWRSANRGLVD